MKSISLPNLKNKVQAVVNEYIRKRDSDFGYFKCISCGKLKSIEFMDAGHYYSTKMYDGLRFNEDNIHGQCKYCNKFLYGNTVNYRDNLFFKIGPERFEKLKKAAEKYKRDGYKWSMDELEKIMEEFKQKIKEHEKT